MDCKYNFIYESQKATAEFFIFVSMIDDDFSLKLIKWYSENKRNLPWRESKSPYKIWISEIILQQTKVDQGLPYYLKFIKKFPNVHDLAIANENMVLKLWQGLGYYSRARNLHYSAKYISNHLNGEFPKTYDELIKLKGVGKYTASAIASFAFNEKKAVLDGNVFRVLSRYFGIEDPIDTTLGSKIFEKIAFINLPSVNIYVIILLTLMRFVINILYKINKQNAYVNIVNACIIDEHVDSVVIISFIIFAFFFSKSSLFSITFDPSLFVTMFIILCILS